MAITDYIPNIFGSTPQAYQGLLTPQQSAALEKRANIGGLLGSLSALAQGMSPQGYRRSPLENIITALGAGYGAAGQTYESGIGQIANLQKLQQSQAQIDAINQLLQNPAVANDPMMVAYIRANPAEAIKYFAEMAPIQKAITGTPSVTAPSAPRTELPISDVMSQARERGEATLPMSRVPSGFFEQPDTTQLAPVTVQAAPGIDATLLARKNALIAQNDRLSEIPSKLASERIDRNIKQIEAIDKQLDRAAVSGFNFQGVEDLVPQQFKGRVASLRQAAETGAITMNDLTQRLQSIEKDATDFVTKKTDYTNQDRRVFGGMFQNPDGSPRAIETASPIELMQLENKLYEMRIAEKKAGATNINMPTESERTAGFLTNRVVNSLNQLQTVVGAKPTAASPNFGAEAVRFLTGSEYLKNLANPEARQQVEAAQLEILDAALTLGTGAAYTREQLENYRRSYFPQLGDKPGTVKDKQNRLKSLIDSAMIKSGRAAPAAPSGVAPAFDIDAITRELDRRKGK